MFVSSEKHEYTIKKKELKCKERERCRVMEKQVKQVTAVKGAVQENKYGVRLPVVEIEGFPFLVDVFNKVLWDAQAADNYIYFHEMQDKGNCYEFTLNRSIRNLPTSWSAPSQDVVVQVPQMVTLDAPGVASMYSMSEHDLPARDKDLKCNADLLQQRLSGVLPMIDIAGDEFRIDMREKEFLKAPPGRARLNFRQMAETSDGLGYEFYYHLPTKTIVSVSQDSRVLPTDVVLVRIPRDEMLDPVDFARKHKLKVQEFVNDYPIQQQLKAKVIPLWKTDLAKIISNNRKKGYRVSGKKRA